jgi:hypothetical protein
MHLTSGTMFRSAEAVRIAQKESRATHAIFITMSRVNKIRHISQKKNARIASRCAQCDMDAAFLSPEKRLHHL